MSGIYAHRQGFGSLPRDTSKPRSPDATPVPVALGVASAARNGDDAKTWEGLGVTKRDVPANYGHGTVDAAELVHASTLPAAECL